MIDERRISGQHGQHPSKSNSSLVAFKYTLTIGEASSLMQAERCKFASNRKVQRMCRDGSIDCYKLQTTRNGQPVSEWLVNETSLRKHIEENEIKWDDGEASFDQSLNSSNQFGFPHANGNAKQPPSLAGDARHTGESGKTLTNSPDAMVMPDRTGDAAGAAKSKGQFPNRVENPGNAMATPGAGGDANDEAFGVEVGETRSLASVLIENAKLTAELEGTRQLIAEIRDDKDFLRDELREARAGRKDVTAIAQRMLETLETIAIGGKLIPASDTRKDRSTGEFAARPVHPEPSATRDLSFHPSSIQTFSKVEQAERFTSRSPTGDNQTGDLEDFGI